MSLPRIPRYVQLLVKNKISVFSLFYLFLVKKYDEGNRALFGMMVMCFVVKMV